MKIVSWNCNCKFREKFAKIRDLDADVYIIQECENPAGYKGTDYDHFAKDHIWTGDNMNKITAGDQTGCGISSPPG